MTLYGNVKVFYGPAMYGDVTAPSLDLTSSAFTYDGYINSSPIAFSATFTEDVTNFTSSDVTVSGGGSISNFAGSGANYTFDVYPAAPGSVTVSVANGAAWDPSGNDITGDSYSFTYDAIQPSVTLSSGDVAHTGSTNTQVISFTAAFSESVTGFVVGDITVTNGTAGNFAGSGNTYTFDVTATTYGAVSVNIQANKAQDASGNQNTASNTYSYNYTLAYPNVTGNVSGTRANETWVGSINLTGNVIIPAGVTVFADPTVYIRANGYNIIVQDGGLFDTQGTRLPIHSRIRMTKVIT